MYAYVCRSEFMQTKALNVCLEYKQLPLNGIQRLHHRPGVKAGGGKRTIKPDKTFSFLLNRVYPALSADPWVWPSVWTVLSSISVFLSSCSGDHMNPQIFSGRKERKDMHLFSAENCS